MYIRFGTSMSGRHQEGRPVDGVELEDVLGEDVERGPELLGQVLALAPIAERRVVVEQGVEPDVDHLLRVPRDRHAPLERRAVRARRRWSPCLMNDERLVAAEVRDARSPGAPRRAARACSWKAESRKNQLSCFSRVSSILWIGQRLPSRISDSVLKSAQRGQYQPS